MMKNNLIGYPKVSVVVPIYNVEKYIERCARSLFEQSLDDIEYLFVDDCTPDNSIEILRSVLEEYPHRKTQVTIHRMEKNSGQAAVRKWGMLNAKGEYVIHCDSDDWVDVNMYRAMYEKARETDADVVVCDYYQSNGLGANRLLKGCKCNDRDVFIEHLLCGKITWSVWNKMFKKSTCYNGIIYPNKNMGEDMVLCIQSVFFAQKIAYIPLPYYYYFDNIGSITKPNHNTEKKAFADYLAVKENAEILFEILKSQRYEKFNKDVTLIEYSVVAPLFPLSYRKKYRDICFKSYEDLFSRVLLSRGIAFKFKLKILLAKIYLFPSRL